MNRDDTNKYRSTPPPSAHTLIVIITPPSSIREGANGGEGGDGRVKTRRLLVVFISTIAAEMMCSAPLTLGFKKESEREQE